MFEDAYLTLVQTIAFAAFGSYEGVTLAADVIDLAKLDPDGGDAVVEARKRVWEKLIAGELRATGFARSAAGRIEIPPQEWALLELSPVLTDGEPEIFVPRGNGPAYFGVAILRAGVERAWKKKAAGLSAPKRSELLSFLKERRHANDDEAQREAERKFRCEIPRETIRELRREAGIQGQPGRPRNSAKN